MTNPLTAADAARLTPTDPRQLAILATLRALRESNDRKARECSARVRLDGYLRRVAAGARP